jgi:hypothetical protein
MVLIGRQYVAGTLHYYRRNQGRTNDKGEYRIEHVLPGEAYLVLARRQNTKLDPISDAPAEPELRRSAEIPTYYPGSPSREGGQLIVLRPGEHREGIDILMLRAPSFCIEGQLTRAGQPAELRFWIRPKEMSFGIGMTGGITGLPQGGTTGPGGKVRICDLAPGEYELTASSLDLNFPEFYGSMPVLIADRDARGVTVSAVPRVVLSGEAVWVGQPPEKELDARFVFGIRPMHRSFGGGGAATGSVPGKFLVRSSSERADVLFDDYWVQPRPLSGSLYIKNITYANTSVVLSPLRLGSAMAGTELRVLVGHDGGFIQARVADKEGQTAADANVVIMPENARSELELAAVRIVGQTDQNGTYSSNALAPGKYYILATTSAVANWSPESMAKLWRARTKAKEIDLAPNATVQLTLEPMALD